MDKWSLVSAWCAMAIAGLLGSAVSEGANSQTPGLQPREGVAITLHHALGSQYTPPRLHGALPSVIPGPLLYGGGPVENAPQVYVVFWGWTSDPSGEAAYLINFLSSVGGSPWLNTVSQYGGGNPPNLYGGSWYDPSPVPAQPTDPQVQAEALAAVQHFGLGTSANIQIVVATPTGQSTAGFGTQFCAYHNALFAYPQVTYTNLPYMTDAGSSCGADSVNGANGRLDGVSIVEGHELAETITDPLIDAWVDASGHEIGDKCAWTGLADIVTANGTFAVQPLWSNLANGCVISTSNTVIRAVGATTVNGVDAAFIIGVDGNLWERSGSGSTWVWTDLSTPSGVGISSAVGVTVTGNTNPFVFITGSDGNLWEDYWTGSAWSWYNLGRPGSVGIARTVGVIQVNGNVAAFVTGSDGNLWERYWAGSAWVWADLGAPSGVGISSAVGVTVTGNANPFVFITGSDGNLWEDYWTGSAWSWYNLGRPGSVGIAGTVGVIQVNGAVGAFVTGSDGNLWERYWSGSAWVWADLGTPSGVGISSAVGAIVIGDADPFVFITGSDGNLWERYWTGSTWSWYNLGKPGGASIAGATGVTQINGAIAVFVTGSDGNVWESYWTGSAWAWNSLGKPN